ncbi:DUF1534 domain-containing protein [Pseudomonas amygdali pv. lachrymans str. M301315]|uniref:DUF1534 domain-containing protein n=1 Tax=Pseudomonas amygdali pv. lachrymans str. M301315 TaxID=629260 RepID=A0AAD0PTR7_PSEAV|nr:DUF1534 domain-containing protein [Pseudomonas amygdali pv. lachrymans str. M301315]PWD02750.1 hypothetical protein CX658_10205 [Pseudomonas amygdali pv. lachrymans]
MKLSFPTLQRGNAGLDAPRRTIVAMIVPHAWKGMSTQSAVR